MNGFWIIAVFSLVSFYSESLYADPEAIPDTNNLILQSRLAGDTLGMRSLAMTHGVDITLQSYSDVLGNTIGGASTGATYSGTLNLGLAIDLETAVGWEGASFKNSWLWVYGNNLSSQYINNALTASGIAGPTALQCNELWFQQNLLQDTVSLRAGLIGLDSEFMLSDTASFFVNSTFGMPGIFTLDVFSGEPAYQNATPGIRLALQPVSWLIFRSACAESSQLLQQVNKSVFNWNSTQSGDFVFLNEVAATWSQDPESKGLPGTAKVGFWVQTTQGTEQSSGDLPITGSTATGGYNSGFYGIIDQQLTIVSDKVIATSSADGKGSVAPNSTQPVSGNNPLMPNIKGLSSFARIGFSPEISSPVSLYADTGFVYTGLIPERDLDKLGIAFGYAAARDPLLSSNEHSSYVFSPSFEAVAELSYSVQLSPTISIQPDLQYILHPGGTQQYGNALVVGMRAVVNF